MLSHQSRNTNPARIPSKVIFAYPSYETQTHDCFKWWSGDPEYKYSKYMNYIPYLMAMHKLQLSKMTRWGCLPWSWFHIYRSIFSWFVSRKHWFSFEETSSQRVAETWFSPMDWLMFLWTVRVGFQDPKSTTKVCISVMKTMDKIGLDMLRARTTNKSFAKVVWNNNDIPWVISIAITLLSERLNISWPLLPTPFLCVYCRQLSWKISCASRIPRYASTTSTTNVDLPPCACKGGPWNIGQMLAGWVFPKIHRGWWFQILNIV